MNSIKKFFTDKNGSIVVFQRPNLPIIAWLLFLGLAKIWQTGRWHSVFSAASTISLIFWALIEIFWGASYFRRVLGVIVLGVIFLH